MCPNGKDVIMWYIERERGYKEKGRCVICHPSIDIGGGRNAVDQTRRIMRISSSTSSVYLRSI